MQNCIYGIRVCFQVKTAAMVTNPEKQSIHGTAFQFYRIF